MMNMFIMISFSISFIFMFLKHPLSLGFMLLIQTIMVSLMTGMMNCDYWYSYILFLVMIGGMLILFIYMTSIASNEKFKFSMKLTMFLMMMSILFLIIINNDSFILSYFMKNSDMSMFYKNMNTSVSFMKFLNYPSNTMLFMIFIYLFITLIAVTKICDKSSGPLRQKF